MAKITINEVSANYSFTAGTSSFASVALPITACWGPAYEDPAALGISKDVELESTLFTHFASSQAGLEAFISTYRGPAANYRSAKDYSYQVAMTLLAAGYDIDICRVCPGAHASGTLTTATDSTLTIRAKYPGTFGNNLIATLNKVPNHNYWNLITYVVDSSGAKTAVENLVFVFDLDNSTDTLLHISEVTSNFFEFIVDGISTDSVEFTANTVTLAGGTDRAADGTAEAMMTNAIELARSRFDAIPAADPTQYIEALNAIKPTADIATASKIRYNEWVYTATMDVLELLTDKLSYNSNRIVLPGWDDQNITEISGEQPDRLSSISPLHAKLMEVAFNSRCATAYIDIPKCLPRSGVFNESTDANLEGYAQKLSRYIPAGLADSGLFSSHSALFAPWGQYTYVGTGKQAVASPSFLALMIQRAMILNQSLQYEWAMPTSRKQNLSIGKLDYIVPKKTLDKWQSSEGVALNVIADIPDLGTSVWGNSTLMEIPVATYNALRNLSTRLLMNAVEDVAYKCGLAITFQYNNDDAYSKFYAGVSPLLDTMENVGAIEKYQIEMSADIDGLNHVNANSVIGVIRIWCYGVIDDITVDLIALPAGVE